MKKREPYLLGLVGIIFPSSVGFGLSYPEHKFPSVFFHNDVPVGLTFDNVVSY